MVALGAALVGGNGAAIRKRKHRRHYGFAHPILSEVEGAKIARDYVSWAVTKVGIGSHYMRCGLT
jgi:hypothetical protein